MKANPFKLNAYDAIRNPDTMPMIMKRAMANIIGEMKTGIREGTKSTLRDPGAAIERFVSAFNIISTSFTRDGIIQGRKGTLELTGPGRARQDKMGRSDAEKKIKLLKRMRTMTAKDRAKTRLKQPDAPRIKLQKFDRFVEGLKADLESGKIREP